MSILKRGLRGEPVRALQEKFGLPMDGEFDVGTERCVKAFQTRHRLAADGVVDPDTFMAMGLRELVLLRLGSRGETVRRLQAALGIQADGRYGVATRDAVVAFQRREGITADGMAGPETLARLPTFAREFTSAVALRAELPPGFSVPRDEPLPPLSRGAIADPSPRARLEPAPERSVWSAVEGWFG